MDIFNKVKFISINWNCILNYFILSLDLGTTEETNWQWLMYNPGWSVGIEGFGFVGKSNDIIVGLLQSDSQPSQTQYYYFSNN